MRTVLDAFAALILIMAFTAQMLRWLRVLQREHYEPAAMSRFLGRWSSPQVASAKSAERTRAKRPVTLTHVLVVILLIALFTRVTALVVVDSALYGILCPQGLSIKGRTSRLNWTRRLKTVAGVTTLLALLIGGLGLLAPDPFLGAVVVVWAVPLLLDLSARSLEPLERRLANRFVAEATSKLRRIAPRVIAVTGSFGKTSTKNHLADLLGSNRGVVATPRSFNNRAGLSRAINETLGDDARVFIAEMGTYGPGEIRELCQWCVPEIAIVTALGPVHLERMKSLDVIESAKREITEMATTVVMNIDDGRLARWPDTLEFEGKRVRTAGSMNHDASVRVAVVHDQWSISVDGREVVIVDQIAGVQATNLACAIAAAIEVGVGVDELVSHLGRVAPVANRANVVAASSGVLVIDDTFNANPASALSALTVLMDLKMSGRRVVVTPGLIELGREQYVENLAFAQKVSARGCELVVVGRTNALALQTGFDGVVRRFDTRDEAVDWVRTSLVVGDGVLYLNDLPDHYP
ncbi:MAG: UDP-N-acetylmuramoyl-tripeptide--D-alanyl-D-alanine ligase [Acidimicrobiaceae bacterium]|nr:UDP-N-acetylmuramoyl-tripeptide--D-alanyl-D-alanine ligase [Acidimicrobiaceae bacterium]